MPLSNLCIITTNKKGYSETFIRNHIQHLPFQKKVLYNGISPVLYDWETEKPLYPPYLYKARKYMAATWGHFSDEKLIKKYVSSYLNSNKIQAVLAEFGPVGVQVADTCVTAGVPLIVHFHGDDAHAERYIAAYNSYQKLMDHARAVVCVSEVMKEQLSKLGFSEQQLHLIPYGIDTGFFKGGNPSGAPPVFLAVGRFVDKKAPHLTILAFHKVVQQIPDARLTMIGTGPLWIACKSLAKSLGIDKQADFKGVCDPHEILDCLRKSRAFLMHSVTPETGEKEGTPLSILEASATGLPVVSTFHAGIPEAVIHQQTGFLTEEYDVEKMADYMITLAEKPEIAHQMGEAGRDHIKNAYDLNRQIQKLADVISSCL